MFECRTYPLTSVVKSDVTCHDKVMCCCTCIQTLVQIQLLLSIKFIFVYNSQSAAAYKQLCYTRVWSNLYRCWRIYLQTSYILICGVKVGVISRIFVCVCVCVCACARHSKCVILFNLRLFSLFVYSMIVCGDKVRVNSAVFLKMVPNHVRNWFFVLYATA